MAAAGTLLVDQNSGPIAHGDVGDGRLEAVIDHLLARDDFGNLLGRERPASETRR
jgi:hypothetical protein